MYGAWLSLDAMAGMWSGRPGPALTCGPWRDDGGRTSLDRMRAMVRRFSTSQPASMDTETLPEYTLEEVAEHTAPSDLW